MSRALAAVLLLLAGCSDPRSRSFEVPGGAPDEIRGLSGANCLTVFHDDRRAVTCWLWACGYQGGLSCLPDAAVKGGSK